MNTQFKKWSPEEEEQLIMEFSQQIDLLSIARAHNRSIRAIELRLADIAIRLQKSGHSSADIFLKTGMSSEDIDKRIREKAAALVPNPVRESNLPNPYTNILLELRDIRKDIAVIANKINN